MTPQSKPAKTGRIHAGINMSCDTLYSRSSRPHPESYADTATARDRKPAKPNALTSTRDSRSRALIFRRDEELEKDASAAVLKYRRIEQRLKEALSRIRRRASWFEARANQTMQDYRP